MTERSSAPGKRGKKPMPGGAKPGPRPTRSSPGHGSGRPNHSPTSPSKGSPVIAKTDRVAQATPGKDVGSTKPGSTKPGSAGSGSAGSGSTNAAPAAYKAPDMNRGPRIDRGTKATMRKVWAWLLEDPSKERAERRTAYRRAAKDPSQLSEREKAILAAEAEKAAKRKAYVKSLVGSVLPGAKGGEAATTKAGKAAKAAKAARAEDAQVGSATSVVPAGADPHADAALVAKAAERAERRGFRWSRPTAAERNASDADGANAPATGSAGSEPADERIPFTDRVRAMFEGGNRLGSMGRQTTFAIVVVLLVWGGTLAMTGFNLAWAVLGSPVDPADPDAKVYDHNVPFFIIESGSMMHEPAPYGRLGSLDPGDMVVVRRVDPEHHREQIQTFYGPGDRKVLGGEGDVIMFLPESVRDGEETQPVIHRAMAYIDVVDRRIPNPNAGAPGQPDTVAVRYYTVEEFGVIESIAITIPELGLRNYQPPHGGYITRGDNVRTNNWADQANGVSPYPVRAERIIGATITEVPYLGLVKIALQGQSQALIRPDEAWCQFLLGKAPCDNWQVFIVGTGILIGGPVLWALWGYSRAVYRRRLDAMVVAAMQRIDALEAAKAAMGPALPEPDRPVVATHTAEDLLAGRVPLPDGLRNRGTGSWAEHRQHASFSYRG